MTYLHIFLIFFFFFFPALALAELEPSSPTVGWEQTVDPVTGESDYNVVAK